MPLAAIGSAIIYTVFLWWFSTGAILWLNRLPRRTFRWSLLAATGVAAASVWGLSRSLSDPTPSGALIAFTCALGVWAWHEMSFLMGFITGPRAAPCPPGTTGWRRFVLASSTLIYHELALALTAVALLALSWGQPNPIGAWTFAVLLVSRLSAKLNIFFGAPNFTEAFFPANLRYLTSYLRRGDVSPLFPLSVAAGAALAAMEAGVALNPSSSAFAVTGLSLLFALTALALLEHAFMVLPLPDEALWRWAVPAEAAGRGATPPRQIDS
jgi:putative photosynthetic complex assembly protein 2